MHAVGQGLLSSVGRMAVRPARQIRSNSALSAAADAVAKRRLTEASSHLLEAVDIARTDWPDSIRLAESLVRLADVFAALEQPDAALPMYREAILLLCDLPDGVDSLLVNAVSNMGRVLVLTGDHPRAIGLISAAIALRNRLGLADTPVLSLNHAVVAAEAGYDEDAGAAFNSAIEAIERGTGSRDMQAIAVHDNYALFCLSRGRAGDAEILLRRCLILRQETASPRHPIYATGLVNLARMQFDTGQCDEAESLLWQAADTCERAGKRPTLGMLPALYYLARIALATGRREDAETLSIRIVEFVELRPATAAAAEAAQSHIQALLQRDGGGADPEPLYRHALEYAENLDSPYRRLGREITGYALTDLAALLAAQGNTAVADRLAARATDLEQRPFWAFGRQVISSID